MPIIKFGNKTPKIDPTALISESAIIIGEVEIGAGCSIWPNTVIRGDRQLIQIGQNTSIQDNTVIHTPARFKAPVRIGRNVTVDHSVVLHGCEIDDNCLIGIHAVILDNAKIESWVIVGAGAIVLEGVIIPPKS